jgi:calcineurin-like phosphoesterase family protein
VVVVSDTHGAHREVILPPGDILIHGGDFSNTGEANQVADLAEWLGTLPHKEKVIIAGNHDITFDKEYYIDRGRERFHPHLEHPYDVDQVRNSLISAGTCRYMEDERADVCGIATYGSPWQPEFCDWAFNLMRGKECRKVWELIPKGTDVLVTHGPALGFGDKNSQGDPCGCSDLRDCVTHIKPRLHIFGHIHEGYGCTTNGTTMFVNGSICDHNYRTSHMPIVIDLPVDTSLPASVCLSNTSEWTLADVTQWYRPPPRTTLLTSLSTFLSTCPSPPLQRDDPPSFPLPPSSLILLSPLSPRFAPPTQAD